MSSQRQRVECKLPKKNTFVADMTVHELRAELKNRGIESATLKLKADLVTKLNEVIASDKEDQRANRIALIAQHGVGVTVSDAKTNLSSSSSSSSSASPSRPGGLYRLPTECVVNITQFISLIDIAALARCSSIMNATTSLKLEGQPSLALIRRQVFLGFVRQPPITLLNKLLDRLSRAVIFQVRAGSRNDQSLAWPAFSLRLGYDERTFRKLVKSCGNSLTRLDLSGVSSLHFSLTIDICALCPLLIRLDMPLVRGDPTPQQLQTAFAAVPLSCPLSHLSIGDMNELLLENMLRRAQSLVTLDVFAFTDFPLASLASLAPVLSDLRFRSGGMRRAQTQVLFKALTRLSVGGNQLLCDARPWLHVRFPALETLEILDDLPITPWLLRACSSIKHMVLRTGQDTDAVLDWLAASDHIVILESLRDIRVPVIAVSALPNRHTWQHVFDERDIQIVFDD